jgi:nucleolar protein 58
MSRMLAAKAALCTRVDALGEDGSFDLGAEHKVKLEARLRVLEEGNNMRRISGTARAKATFEKFHTKSEILEYPAAADSVIPGVKRRISEIEDKKPLIEEIGVKDESPDKPKKKKKKMAPAEEEENVVIEPVEETPLKKKKKKKKVKELEAEQEVEPEQEIKQEHDDMAMNVDVAPDG